jgi:hypothetical protein
MGKTVRPLERHWGREVDQPAPSIRQSERSEEEELLLYLSVRLYGRGISKMFHNHPDNHLKELLEHGEDAVDHQAVQTVPPAVISGKGFVVDSW